MAASSWAVALDFVWRPENDGQAYHDDPHDTGGGTNRGVIETTWAGAVRQGIVAPGALRDATLAELGRVLRVLFWNAVQGDALAAGVDLAVFNLAMAAGSGRAAQILQSVLGVTQDMHIGPMTLAAAARWEAAALVQAMTSAEEGFYARCATARYFLRGWDRRADQCRDVALGLAGYRGTAAAPTLAPPPAEAPDPATDALNAAEAARHTALA